MPDVVLLVRLKQDVAITLDLELSCRGGEILALVGPSGSGKSTTLRSIAGLYRPSTAYVASSGTVWCDTQSGIFVPPHRRRVGLVFQHYALFPHMNALANVTAAMQHRPRDQRRKRGLELLELLHLDGLEARRPAELSGGQQQRVAVARALARDPEVLLLDEPFSAVDKATRQRLYRELAELRSTLRMPVVLVTHDFDEAARLADRMCLLEKGRIIQSGRPAEVLARPASAAAARLVDLKNIFFGRVRGHEGGRTLIDWDGRLITVARRDDFEPGEKVVWALPSTQVILHRQGGKSDGEAEANVFVGSVKEVLLLSENTAISVELDAPGKPVLSMTVPAHYAVRTALASGSRVCVELLGEGIHLMRDEGS